jgi:hypothetical protein
MKPQQSRGKALGAENLLAGACNCFKIPNVIMSSLLSKVYTDPLGMVGRKKKGTALKSNKTIRI